MNIVYFLLYIYLLLKPYYLFDSGGLQISDLFLIIAFIIFLIAIKSDKTEVNIDIKNNKLFLIFVGCTFIINIIYFIIYFKFKFILSSLYYLYNYIAIIIFSYAFRRNKKFYTNIGNIFKINLFIQLVFCLLSIGKVYGSFRWMGFFNDPNQFGFYIFISFCFIYFINCRNNRKLSNSFIYFVISLYLILECASTAMLLGMLVFLGMFLIHFLKNAYTVISKNINKIIVSLIIGIPIILILILSNIDIIDKDYIKENIFNSNIVIRITDKIARLTKGNENSVGNTATSWSLSQERGYDKIYLYPKYILYGAGEGEYTRFSKAVHMGEIHATFPSILFYYGLIPTFFLSIWVIKNMKKIRLREMIIYIPLLIESFFLLNSRQSLFWIIIAIGGLMKKDERRKNE